MADIWYSDPIRPFPTYVLRAAKRGTCTKFHHDSFKTERLVCRIWYGAMWPTSPSDAAKGWTVTKQMFGGLRLLRILAAATVLVVGESRFHVPICQCSVSVAVSLAMSFLELLSISSVRFLLYSGKFCLALLHPTWVYHPSFALVT